MIQSEVTIGTDFRGNRSNIAGPSAELFSFTSNLHQYPKKEGTLKCSTFQLVEAAGFEPVAFASRTQRSTKLSYTSI